MRLVEVLSMVFSHKKYYRQYNMIFIDVNYWYEKNPAFMISSRLFDSSCDGLDLEDLDQLVPYLRQLLVAVTGFWLLLPWSQLGSFKLQFVSEFEVSLDHICSALLALGCNVAVLIALGEILKLRKRTMPYKGIIWGTTRMRSLSRVVRQLVPVGRVYLVFLPQLY